MSGSRSSSSGRSSSGTSGRAKARGSRKFSVRVQFLLRFVLFFALAFLVWIVTTPMLNTMLTYVGEKVVFLFDGNDLTQSLTSSGRNILLVFQPSDGKPHVVNYRNISFNFVFLMALIMAVPEVHYRLRLKILLLGYAFLFPVQVTRLVVYIFNYYGQHIDRDGLPLYSDVPRKALLYIDRTLQRLDGQIVPVIIWAGLYFYYKWQYKYFKRDRQSGPS